MKLEKDSKRHFIGRVEVRAAQAEIESMLAAGQPYAWIFDKLAGEGRLTISYRQFCRCLALYFGVTVRPKKKNGEKKGSVSILPSVPAPEVEEKKDWSIKGADWKPGTTSDELLF